MRHPAREIPFDDLYAGLEAARSAGLVVRQDCVSTGRAIYVYSQQCVYNQGWNEFALMARGLILHPGRRQVVATPFPKFFNVGEHGVTIPDAPFEVFEKVDGSLAIIHHFDGAWRVATKGDFESAQARWAGRQLESAPVEALRPGVTYLAEAVYPENRIVVRYPEAGLVLLGAYEPDGSELSHEALLAVAGPMGWRVAARRAFASFADLIEHAKSLPATEEGFVARFAGGFRLKVKGNEYRRIHALISRCTPLAMWEAMRAGDDMAAIRRDLPEEFWADFDAITHCLSARLESLRDRVARMARELEGVSDKDLGLRLGTLDPETRRFIFQWRKSNGRLEGRALDALYRQVRPTGNVLEGYAPSHAMHRVLDEAG